MKQTAARHTHTHMRNLNRRRPSWRGSTRSTNPRCCAQDVQRRPSTQAPPAVRLQRERAERAYQHGLPLAVLIQFSWATGFSATCLTRTPETKKDMIWHRNLSWQNMGRQSLAKHGFWILRIRWTNKQPLTICGRGASIATLIVCATKVSQNRDGHELFYTILNYCINTIATMALFPQTQYIILSSAMFRPSFVASPYQTHQTPTWEPQKSWPGSTGLGRPVGEPRHPSGDDSLAASERFTISRAA